MEHLRYPEDLFKVQRYQFARYHVTDAERLVRRATTAGRSRRTRRTTHAASRRTASSSTRRDSRGRSTSVYVPREKNNLASFVSVNSDATDTENYGKIQVLELPNERTAGPGQVANELQPDEDVREELLGFTQGGVDPIYGNLLTLPVGDGLMYVQPLYARRSDDADVELPDPAVRARVVRRRDRHRQIAARGDRRRARCLGDRPDTEPDAHPGSRSGAGDGDPDPTPTGSVNDQIRGLLAEAEAKFEAADKAQANGNTVGWARLMEQGRDLITQAIELSGVRGLTRFGFAASHPVRLCSPTRGGAVR